MSNEHTALIDGLRKATPEQSKAVMRLLFHQDHPKIKEACRMMSEGTLSADEAVVYINSLVLEPEDNS